VKSKHVGNKITNCLFDERGICKLALNDDPKAVNLKIIYSST